MLRIEALSGNPVISVMVSWMYNDAKDVKTKIDNTLRVSRAFAPFSLNWKTITQRRERRDGAKNKSLRVYSTGIFDRARIDPETNTRAEFGNFEGTREWEQVQGATMRYDRIKREVTRE